MGFKFSLGLQKRRPFALTRSTHAIVDCIIARKRRERANANANSKTDSPNLPSRCRIRGVQSSQRSLILHKKAATARWVGRRAVCFEIADAILKKCTLLHTIKANKNMGATSQCQQTTTTAGGLGLLVSNLETKLQIL